MTATEYLFAVQTDTGHEVCSTRLTVERVSDVTAVQKGSTVEIHQRVSGDEKTSLGGVVATAEHTGDAVLQLHRWPADDKLAQPVTKPVKTAAAD